MSSRFILPTADVGSGITPSDGAQLFFFETGTSTDKDTFTTEAATVANSNPVTADASGVFPDIFLVGTYRVQLKDKNGVQTGFGVADPVKETTGVGDANNDKRYGPIFATEAAMTAANPVSIDGVVVTLVSGMTATIQGFTAAGDQDRRTFLIKTSAEFGSAPNEERDFVLANGNVAVGQPAISDIIQGSMKTVLGGLSAPDNSIDRFFLTEQGTGAGNVIQDFCVDPYLDELYTMHVTGAPETTVINKFVSSGVRAQTSNRWTATPNAVVGHQGFDVSWQADGTRWFWTAAGEQQTNADFSVVRFQIADGGGTDLTISNTGVYLLFPTDFTVIGNIVTCAVSTDGRWLLAEVRTATTENTLRVFDLHELIDAGPGDFSVNRHVFEFVVTDIIDASHPLQGIACDGATAYIFAGNNPTDNLRFGAYNFKGETLYLDTDFTVGELLAQGDGAGTDYEAEGLGWLWHGGEPRLSCVIASGDSGNRTNRIWMLSTSIPVTAFGEGNIPAFLASGAKDFGIPKGETCRIGHHDAAADTFDDQLGFDANGVTLYGDRNSGTFTVTAEDNVTKGVGNVSATTAVGKFFRNGPMMFVTFTINNIDVTGMTGANNLYIHGTALAPAAADSNFTMIPTNLMTVAGAMYTSDFDFDPIGVQVVPAIEATGGIGFREMRDGLSNVIANVSQFDGADINLSGWFKVS